MKKYFIIYFILFFGLFAGSKLFAQDEEMEIEQDSIADQNAANKFQEMFFKALSERGIENYDKAIEILSELEKVNTFEPAIYFQLGLNYFDIENYDSALLNYEKANKLKPEDYNIKEAIFKVYEQQKKYDQAIEIAQFLSLKDAEYHNTLANLFLITKQYQNALNSLNKAEESQGFDSYNDKLRVIIFEKYDKPQIAIDYYKRRIEEEPFNPLNDYRLAEFLVLKGNTEEAISTIQMALNKHPRFSRYYVLQIQIFTKTNQREKALAALESVVTDKFLEEKYKVEAINYFKAYVETHPDAENDFVQILDLASQSAKDNSSFLDLGLYYLETDKARSLENFKKAKAQNPQDFQILKYISVLHFQLNQYDEAIQIANESLEIYPTQAIFMLIKGESLVMLTQYNEAKSVLLDALSYVFEENEIMQRLYENLSQAYKGLNETEKATDYQNKANAIKKKLN